MKLRQSIKKILKEESNRESKIFSAVEKYGIIKTCGMVGGINQLASILNETPEGLLTKYLSKETFSTDDIEKNTGGYNFKFKLQFVEKYNDYYDFFFVIEEGTVELIMTDDDTEYNLFGNYIRELESWWEIKYEIKGILYDFVKELNNKIKFDDITVNDVDYTFKDKR